MKALIIGSTAAYHWFPKFRIPRDLDILTPVEIKSTDPKLLYIDASWHEAAEDLIAANTDPVFMDPELLLTLKISHSFWDVNWDKTLIDIHKLMLEGVKYDIEASAELHAKLYAVWERIHGAKRVDMMQPADEFFTSAVPRRYDHDQLHQLVVGAATPTYRKFQTNPPLVHLDLSQASHEDLMKLAFEEMMVVAIERGNLTPTSHPQVVMRELLKAHKRLAISMTKGKFAMFLVLNAYQLRSVWIKRLTEYLCSRLQNLNDLTPLDQPDAKMV